MAQAEGNAKMENITSNTPQIAAQLFEYVPEVRGLFRDSWVHMTENYTKFQIATWGSILVHQVDYACFIFGMLIVL